MDAAGRQLYRDAPAVWAKLALVGASVGDAGELASTGATLSYAIVTSFCNVIYVICNVICNDIHTSF